MLSRAHACGFGTSAEYPRRTCLAGSPGGSAPHGGSGPVLGSHGTRSRCCDATVGAEGARTDRALPTSVTGAAFQGDRVGKGLATSEASLSPTGVRVRVLDLRAREETGIAAAKRRDDLVGAGRRDQVAQLALKLGAHVL